MFHFTDIGTDMLAPLSMIATVTAFSLFTAYQFLSSDEDAFTPERKNATISIMCAPMLSTLMMEMIATSFFLCLLRINF